jgi:hypothetical protein
MFRPTGLNKKKLEALDEQTRLSEQEEMRARDEARQGAYQGRQRMDGVMQDLQKPTQLGASKANRSRREEFKFEDDDGEQEANNEEIDNQIDQIAAGVSMLHGAARVINEELEDQIRQVDRITEKVSAPQHGISKWWCMSLTYLAERACARPGPQESHQPPAGGQDELGYRVHPEEGEERGPRIERCFLFKIDIGVIEFCPCGIFLVRFQANPRKTTYLAITSHLIHQSHLFPETTYSC